MLRALLEARNVVVRAPNALGDLVMATPAFARLAAHYGRDRLSLVCLPAGESLLRGNVWFREVLAYDRKGRHAGFGGSLAFARELRKRRFDLGIILPNSLGSAFQFLWGGVKRRVGYFKEGRRFLLHAGRPRDHDEQGRFVPKYTGRYFMDLLDVMGLPPAPLVPVLPLTAEEQSEAGRALAERGLVERPFVVIAPGAAFGPSKLWPAERFAAVADALAGRGLGVLFSLGPGEEETVAAVRRHMRADAATTQGLSLGVIKAVIARAALVLTNDTGPRHVAVALGRPVVCVMGPNDPRYSALPEVEKGEVVRQPVDCAPYAWPCQLKECPIDHRCMTAIDAERVLKACLKHLADAGNAGASRTA
ncbi:MAG: lipopolysaccharide heptosyltransferase II [Planctomycetes bacterium]|nr:lipopolysaccharide heptosyltransferase II [Planctomycetota bacterium]MCL4731515.1 lipopolysaccharide heptosyltransferase II [Planctomycetota bacterium]